MQTSARAEVELTGVSPLVLNNIRLADPTDPITMQVKEINSKPRKTPEDMANREELQWHGSLYLDVGGRLVFPVRSVMKAIADAAKGFKLGAAVERGGVGFREVEVPLIHDGPDDPAKLWADEKYRFRTIVNGNPSARNRAMVPSMRPIFPIWSLKLNALVFTEILGWDSFIKIVDAAGAQGIGNARKLGMGKFEAKVTRL